MNRARGRHALAVREFGWAIPLPFLIWPIVRLVRGEARPEHILFAVVLPILAWATPRTKKLFFGILPVAILGLVYDAMGFVKNWGLTEARVHDCDLQAIESRLFGWSGEGRPYTVHDWLQAHATPSLDLLAAIPYGTFIFASFAFVAYLYFRDYPRMQRFGWTFLCINLLGFVTYHVYPAAPPWYFHAHGCAIDLAAHASEGPNLARVDHALGVSYFASFYGRSSDVFGAIPSLHVAYPLLICLFGFPYFGRALRATTAVYFALMCFAAVYLDHHWVIDVIVGVSYTLAGFFASRLLTRRKSAALERGPLVAS